MYNSIFPNSKLICVHLYIIDISSESITDMKNLEAGKKLNNKFISGSEKCLRSYLKIVLYASFVIYFKNYLQSHF